MELLNSDMEKAISELSSNDSDKKIVRDILYQERLRKELDWDNEAAKIYQNILDGEEKSDD
jgi:hypothetical protein